MIKPGVDVKGLEPEILLAIQIVSNIYRERNKAFILTSVKDGVHSKGSLHYKGLAFDCRTRHLEQWDKQEIYEEAKQRLGSQYDVVLESTHLHIEFDP